MPGDKLASMDERLWILEDLNMMYIRQIALSLQVRRLAPAVVPLSLCCYHLFPSGIPKLCDVSVGGRCFRGVRALVPLRLLPS